MVGVKMMVVGFERQGAEVLEGLEAALIVVMLALALSMVLPHWTMF